MAEVPGERQKRQAPVP